MGWTIINPSLLSPSQQTIKTQPAEADLDTTTHQQVTLAWLVSVSGLFSSEQKALLAEIE
jgi:hypothetical protein